ncbi:MAG: hypothetical protein U0559_16365 [Anaerolineae bacterium]
MKTMIKQRFNALLRFEQAGNAQHLIVGGENIAQRMNRRVGIEKTRREIRATFAPMRISAASALNDAGCAGQIDDTHRSGLNVDCDPPSTRFARVNADEDLYAACVCWHIKPPCPSAITEIVVTKRIGGGQRREPSARAT